MSEADSPRYVYCPLCEGRFDDNGKRLCPTCAEFWPEMAEWPVDDSWQRTEDR